MRSGFCAIVIVMAPALALAQGEPTVTVTLGPAVQARARELGAVDLEAQRAVLQHRVEQALAGALYPVRQVDLAIVDIQPTRPTTTQLGASAALSRGASLAEGGAAITGQVVGADGAVRPIHFRSFLSDLRFEQGFDTWSDAEDAFSELARDLGRGQAPDDKRSWPPPHRPETLTGTRLPG